MWEKLPDGNPSLGILAKKACGCFFFSFAMIITLVYAIFLIPFYPHTPLFVSSSEVPPKIMETKPPTTTAQSHVV